MSRTLIAERQRGELPIDTELLRKQRNELIGLAEGRRFVAETDLDGVINMMDAILDLETGA